MVNEEFDRLRRTLGKNLRWYCKVRGMGINELARTSGVSKSQLYCTLRRERNPSLGMICRLAVALGVSARDLLYDDGVPANLIL